MAEYKVAQDVEAEDKLIGPFSFRQFIYLIIVAIAGATAWGLAQIFIPLAVIPLPVIFLFGALALPLRKDQPMEVYLAAVVLYFLKPRKRIWNPDGVESLVEITTPVEVEVQRTKDLAQDEVERRFSYLADIADTGGWSIRHVAPPPPVDNSMAPDQYFAAQQVEDTLGETGGVAHNFDKLISDADTARRQRMVEQMQHAAENPAPSASSTSNSSNQNDSNSVLRYSPYPTIHQSVISPIGSQSPPPAGSAPQPSAASAQTTPDTSAKPVSDDIISLANNSDLSIQTIQREASRIQHKEEADDGEVFISLH